MKSPSSASSRSSRSSRSTGASSGRMVRVKCSFCGNTFYAVPSEAVCRKCNRPANRPMMMPLRLASFILPVFGLPYSLWLRPHSPFAAHQGLVASLAGAAFYLVGYFGRHLL